MALRLPATPISELLPLILPIFSAILAIVLPLYIYKYFKGKLKGLTKIEETIKALEESLNKKYEELSSKYDEKKFDDLTKRTTGIEEELKDIKIRINTLDNELKKLRKPLFPLQVEEEVKEVEVDTLQQMQAYYPFIKYIAIITSQGFTVETLGNAVIEPEKLLEIIKLSNIFTGSREITLEKKDEVLYIFYIDSLEDLDIYGILSAEKPMNIKSLGVVKKVLQNYFRKKELTG